MCIVPAVAHVLSPQALRTISAIGMFVPDVENGWMGSITTTTITMGKITKYFGRQTAALRPTTPMMINARKRAPIYLGALFTLAAVTGLMIYAYCLQLGAEYDLCPLLHEQGVSLARR